MRFWYLLAWVIVVYFLIMMFGVMTAPLLFILAVDTIVAGLIIRDCLALQPAAAAGGVAAAQAPRISPGTRYLVLIPSNANPSVRRCPGRVPTQTRRCRSGWQLGKLRLL